MSKLTQTKPTPSKMDYLERASDISLNIDIQTSLFDLQKNLKYIGHNLRQVNHVVHFTTIFKLYVLLAQI